MIKICLDYIERQNNRAEKVVEFYQPEEIIKMFDFSIPDSPLELDRLVEDCRKTLSFQVKTGKFEGVGRLGDSEQVAGSGATARGPVGQHLSRRIDLDLGSLLVGVS